MANAGGEHHADDRLLFPLALCPRHPYEKGAHQQSDNGAKDRLAMKRERHADRRVVLHATTDRRRGTSAASRRRSDQSLGDRRGDGKECLFSAQ